ncbi:MAG: methyltransferase domain-containing protein, partial [Nitrospirae bacterium]
MIPFLELKELPIHCNLLWSSREEALKAPKGDIHLAYCQACSMIYNVAFDPTQMNYAPGYETSLHFSQHFQSYASELAHQLVERYNLVGKTIIEIGCGRGEFLSLLCERGRNRGIGFDPSYEKGKGERQIAEHVTIIEDVYSERYAKYKADFVCCRHVLEHIYEPRNFLAQLRAMVKDQPETVLFFEVPNAMYTIKDGGIWDIIYEHCSYFSAPSLTRLFAEIGLEVLRFYEMFGGQFLCIEASLKGGKMSDSHVPQGELCRDHQSCLQSSVPLFAERYRKKVNGWRDTLRHLAGKGERILVWGAGSKGVTFLNTVQESKSIEYVVDLNPHKQGRYIPGTGQKVIPPES